MKKRKLIFLLPIAAMALGACGKKDDSGSSDPGEQEHEEEVTLTIKDKANFELEVEATKQLEAVLKGTTGTLVWSSSAEGVATVDQTGKVTAVAVGSATISVTFGEHADFVTVTVKAGEVPPTPVSFEDAYKEAEKLSADGESETAEAYTLIGVVAARQGNSFFMQNGAYCIEVYNKTINDAPAVIGKEVKVVSTLQNYYGNIETKTVTSVEYTGNDGVISPVSIPNKAALDAARINMPLTPAKLTVVSIDGTYSSKKADGKLSVKIGSDSETVTLILSKYCVNEAAASVLAGVKAGDALLVDKAICAAFKGAMQLSLSDDSVVTKEAAPQKELESISIEGSLAKASYEEGDAYSAEGLSVKAHYKDGSSDTVAATITFDKATAALGDVLVTASVSYLGEEASQEFAVTVTEKVVHTAISYTFTNEKTQAQNMSSWTSEQFMQHVVSDGAAVITGMSSPTNAYIGGNGGSGDTAWNIWNCLKVGKSNAKGSISLTLDPAATFSAIKMEVVGARDDGTLTVNGITKDVTKKATVDDLTTMTLEFAISENTGTLELSSKDATSNNYGICITKISFVDAVVPEPVPELSSIELTTGPSKTEYYAGEEFNAEGMVITAKYTHGGEDKVLQASEYTIDKTTLALEDEYVTVSYTEDEITKTVQVPVTVTKAPVPVTGITLNEEELSMHVLDADVQLVATVAPDDADDKTVTWTVSEDGVVTVENGLVHAVAPGEVVVTATAGDCSATCTVTVAAAEKVISGIEVTTPPTKTTYVEGETFNPEGMKITVTYSSAHEPEEISSGFVCSTDPLVLDQTTVDVEYNGFHASASVTVTPAPVLDSITVANATGKTNAYTVGDVISKDDLVVTAHYTQGKQDAVVTDYTISKTTALAVTDTSVTISYTEGGIEKTATYSFTVEAAPVITTSKITIANDFPGSSYAANNVERFASDASGLAFETNQAQIIGGEIQLQSATGKIWTTSPINNGIKKIEFTTTSTVLEVYVGNVLCPNSENGGVKLTGNDGVYEVSSETYKYLSIINGSATSKISTDISITYNGTISSYLIPVHSILLSDSSVDLAVGGTKQVTASVSPSTVSNGSVTWSVQNESVSGCVTVSQDGLITGVAEGTAKVVCTSVLTPEVKEIINVTVSADVVTADVTYAFATAESDSSSDMGGGLLSRFTDNVQDGTNLVTAATGTKCYDGIYGLKFGSGKAAGKAVITTSAAISKIVVRAIAYGTDKTVIKINGEEIALSSEMATYEVTFGTTTTSITIEAKNASNCRYYISSIAMFK